MNAVILALEILGALLRLAPHLRDEWSATLEALGLAQAEGRDLTDAELAPILARAQAATDALLATEPPSPA